MQTVFYQLCLHLHQKSPAGQHPVYVFLNEVQEINEWERGVNSLLAEKKHRDQAILQYLLSVYSTTLLKDIVMRNNIRDAVLLEKLIEYTQCP